MILPVIAMMDLTLTIVLHAYLDLHNFFKIKYVCLIRIVGMGFLRIVTINYVTNVQANVKLAKIITKNVILAQEIDY